MAEHYNYIIALIFFTAVIFLFTLQKYPQLYISLPPKLLIDHNTSDIHSRRTITGSTLVQPVRRWPDVGPTIHSMWQTAPFLEPLHVRHKMWDSGGDQTHLNDVISKQTNISIKILLWETLFGRTGLEFGSGQTPFLYYKCPVWNCEIYNDRKLLSWADALVFHMPTFKPMENPPRSLHQKWIFFGKESPRRFYYFLDNQYFNLTMTYRRDSDIFLPYSIIVPLSSESEAPKKRNFAAGKTRLVAWMASNCESTSRRANYVKQLVRHLHVDTYGVCGTKRCPRNISCYSMLNKTYKFYLAFENSLCADYVTEKLYRTLTWDVVPIVLGAANYSAILPPNSFIDIRDFTSPKQLALYLRLLDINDDKYNQFFEWKQHYKVQNMTQMGNMMCSLCHGLHMYRNTTSIVPDIKSWWLNSRHDRITYFKYHAPENVYMSPKARRLK